MDLELLFTALLLRCPLKESCTVYSTVARFIMYSIISGTFVHESSARRTRARLYMRFEGLLLCLTYFNLS